MKSLYRKIVIALGLYLLSSCIFSFYVEYRYKRLMTSLMSFVGVEYANSGAFERDVRADPEFKRFRPLLGFLPPVGWIVESRIDNLENSIFFLFANLAIPESARFSSLDDFKRYGIDQNVKTDEDIARELFDITRFP